MPPLSFSRRTAAGVPLRPAFAALMLAALLPMGCGTGNAPGAAVQPAPAAIQPEAATLSDDRGAPPPPPPLPEPGALVGRGFAQVAGQPGQTLNEKRLLAIRAARLDAMRDLTEQVHGIRISSDSLLRDAAMQSDYVAAQVQGTMRGARTVSIEPRGDDGYAVQLELSQALVAQIARAAR